MSLETSVVPKLVNSKHFPVKTSSLPILPKPLKPKKVNLNILLLVLFVICTVSFLYYCKYKTPENINVIPFNLYEKY
jgi:hypothetical protein